MSTLPDYRNEKLPFEERARDLVSRMTLMQKVSQMLFNAKAVPELGIPSYNWWNEALHGVARAGVATVFPQAIGMAAAFDAELIRRAADIISTEGRAKYHEFQRKGDHGIYKGLTFWSPNINIFRDPRWGRGHETYGEDPYLTGKLGVAFIRGLQGDHPRYLKAAACAKHYAVHSGPEAERHEFNAEVSRKDLYETYLPAFRDAVKDGKVEAVMGAYNRVNGEPCCGSETLLQKILREQWGFEGHVVSDCGALKDFHEFHKVTANAVESAAMALNNGCDLNCGNMFTNLIPAFEEGLVTEETIDRAVTRLVMARMKLGMFDEPDSVPFNTIPYEANDSKENRSFALEVARQSIVLLKNEGDLLPLDKFGLRSIAVIGPNADNRRALEGNYQGTASEYVTVLDGIRQAVPEDTRIYYAEGCHLYKNKVEGLGETKDRMAEAEAAAERADAVVLCLGLDPTLEGEEGDENNLYGSGDKNDLNLPGLQQELLERVMTAGKPVVLVVMSGSALALTWADEHVPAVVQAWYPGAEGGRAVASLLFGEYSPSGRLPVTFYRSTEELPDFRDYSMRNRTYRYMQQEALYPFGFGLSYTRFEYSAVLGDALSLPAGESLEVKAAVRNAGTIASGESVQLYVKHLNASVPVPNWELKGFAKVFLEPGEETTVSFRLEARDLAVIDAEGRRVQEPGRLKVYVGGSQPDRRSLALTGGNVVKYEVEITGEEALELEY